MGTLLWRRRLGAVENNPVQEKSVPDAHSINMDKKEKYQYTKTEINRMSTSDLRQLAFEQGIENAEETSGADLKKMLIEKFEL